MLQILIVWQLLLLYCAKMSWISDIVFVCPVVKVVTSVRLLLPSTIFSSGMFEKTSGGVKLLLSWNAPAKNPKVKSTLRSAQRQETPSEVLSQQLDRLWDPRQPITARSDSQAKLLFSSLNSELMWEFTSWPQWGQSLRRNIRQTTHLFKKIGVHFALSRTLNLSSEAFAWVGKRGSIKCTLKITNQKIWFGLFFPSTK